MNLGEFKKMFESQGNNMVNGSVSVSVVQSAFVFANYAFFKKQAGIEDSPNAGPYWQKCQQVSDCLVPFVKVLGEGGNSYLTIAPSGYADIPPDYWMFSSMIFPYFITQPGCSMEEREKEIIMVTDEEFNARVASTRKKPSKLRPICTMRLGKIRFAPKDLLRAKMVYLRKPADPFFDYDWIDGQIVYLPPGQLHVNSSVLPIGTPSRSVEFEYPEKYHVDLYAVFASFLADNLMQQTVKRSSEQFKSIGQ